jgi:hypothetical protein
MEITPPKSFFVIDSKAYWHGDDGWYSCDVEDFHNEETPSGSTETIIRWADAEVIDPDNWDNFAGVQWLVHNTSPWFKIMNEYEEAKQRQELARFEELINQTFGGVPIGKIDTLDVLGHWGVHFEIGGHSWVVFRTLDVDTVYNLGCQLTCQGLDGHGDCEDQWATLVNGYHYRGSQSDMYVQRFVKETVTEFMRDGSITRREFPAYGSREYFAAQGRTS